MKHVIPSSLLFTVLSLAGCAISGAAAQTINLDGSFDDWSSIKPAVSDPADAAPDSFVDFRDVSAEAEGDFVHLLVDFGKPENIQRLHGAIYIIFDVDGNAKTGRTMYGLPGADVAVVLSPPSAKDPTRTGGGIAVESATYEPPAQDSSKPSWAISPYTIGFTFAPTYQSQTVEMRVRRGSQIPHTPTLFTGKRFGFVLVAMDPHRNILDVTKPAYCNLPPLNTQPLVANPPGRAASQSPSETNPIARAPHTDFRALSWNVEFSSLVHHPQDFLPVLKAADPDIILFQEIDDHTTADQLLQLLRENLNSGGGNHAWTVFLGAGGGNLHSALASRLPMTAIDSLAQLAFPGQPDRTTRHCSALINVNNHALLATSIHLRCCGSADSEEETARMLETDVLNDAVRTAEQSLHPAGVLFTGDFNLVGARKPLENLAAGLDLDQSDLAVADPFQIDGRSNATWADPDQPYVPGRLDYVLFSDSTLKALHAFVFDAADLPAALGKQLGIDQKMTARASDHLPVVVDFQWTAPSQPAHH